MLGVNPGYRRHLRLAADEVVRGVADPVPTLLDLGCGSGRSTRELLRAARHRGLTPRIIGIDASAGMLQRARAKSWPEGVIFVQGSAEDLGSLGIPRAHGALAADLLRNVPDIDAALVGVRTSLAPGGSFVAAEYSVQDDPRAARRWKAANAGIILPLARATTGEVERYRQVHSSVAGFMGMGQLTAHLQDAGFTDVATRTVRGWQRGILHLVRGKA